MSEGNLAADQKQNKTQETAKQSNSVRKSDTQDGKPRQNNGFGEK